MKIPLVETELLHADGRTDGLIDGQTDGRTDRHDEANKRFSQFCECAKQRTLQL
jgi:hypothetical protein